MTLKKPLKQRSTRSLFMAQKEAYLQELVHGSKASLPSRACSRRAFKRRVVTQRSRQIPQTLQNAVRGLISEAKALGSS